MRRPYQIAGIVLVLFGLLMIQQSLALSFYTRLGPGPGFFPFWVSLFLALLGVAMAAQATFADMGALPDDFVPDREGRLTVAAIFGGLLFLVATMSWIGFRLSMMVFIVVVLVFLGARHWLAIGLTALAGSFGMHYVVSHWLRIHLPTGLLGF